MSPSAIVAQHWSKWRARENEALQRTDWSLQTHKAFGNELPRIFSLTNTIPYCYMWQTWRSRRQACHLTQ